MTALWQTDLDLDWEIERLLLDESDRCGLCGSGLYTDGTCPICDRGPR